MTKNLKDSIMFHVISWGIKTSISEGKYYTISSVFSLRNFGCAVMGLCYLARGFIDSYIGDELKAWDFAAGVIIATEAGAKITLDDGSPFNLAERSIIGSCTDEIHRETVRLVREADQNPLNIA